MATWKITVISDSKIMSGVLKRSIVVITNLRPQFVSPRDDITTIWLREIAWDIHFGQESVLDLRRRSDALGPPVGAWLKRTTHLDRAIGTQGVLRQPKTPRSHGMSQVLIRASKKR